jgi:cell division protein FtsL
VAQGRRVGSRGRAVVALLLCAFVLAAAAVVWRRTVGMSRGRALDALAQRRLELQAQRAKLEGDIRESASRARLAPQAERRLNMHVATDSQYVILPRPSAQSTPSASR